MRDYDKEIQELENKIKELKKEKKRLLASPKNQTLAEAIHKVQCLWNHTDGCGWFYEDWENPGSSRKQYLEKANCMLSEMTFEEAMKIIEWM